MRFHIPDAPVPVLTHRTVKVGDLPQEKVIAVGVGASSTATSAGADGGTVPERKQSYGDKATDDLYLTKFKSHFHRK